MRDIDEMIADTRQVMLRSAATALLPMGVAPTPQLAVFDERNCGEPLVAMVTCRDYQPGRDAAEAITHMGRLAAALAATHLLVFWEEADLHRSFTQAAQAPPSGLAILEANYRSHQLHWYPFAATVRGYRPSGGADLNITWGAPTSCPGAALHQPVEGLLSWSREVYCNRYEVDEMLTRAVEAGYGIARFAAPVTHLG